MKKTATFFLGALISLSVFSQVKQGQLGIVKDKAGKETLTLGSGTPFISTRAIALGYETVILAQPLEQDLMILYVDGSAGCFGKGSKMVFLQDSKTLAWYNIDLGPDIVMAGKEDVRVRVDYEDDGKRWSQYFFLLSY